MELETELSCFAMELQTLHHQIYGHQSPQTLTLSYIVCEALCNNECTKHISQT